MDTDALEVVIVELELCLEKGACGSGVEKDTGVPGCCVGCGNEGIVRIWCRVQYCIDFGVLKDICLHRVRGWSSTITWCQE